MFDTFRGDSVARVFTIKHPLTLAADRRVPHRKRFDESERFYVPRHETANRGVVIITAHLRPMTGGNCWLILIYLGEWISAAAIVLLRYFEPLVTKQSQNSGNDEKLALEIGES